MDIGQDRCPLHPLVDKAIRSGILCLVHASIMAREPGPWMFLAPALSEGLARPARSGQ